MEKKEYNKPHIAIISFEAVSIMAGSIQSIPKGEEEEDDENLPEEDEDGYIWGE